MRGSTETGLATVSDGEVARAIAAAAPGAAQAEESELYRRFARRVQMYGRKHLHDDSAADDLAQQVLLVTIERLRAGEVRTPDEIGSFILGTSRLLAGSIKRKTRRRESLTAPVTIVTRQASGDEIGRLSDVTVRPGQREILNAFSAAHLRTLPATRVHVSVIAPHQGGDRTLAEYTLEHGGAFDRPPGTP